MKMFNLMGIQMTKCSFGSVALGVGQVSGIDQVNRRNSAGGGSELCCSGSQEGRKYQLGAGAGGVVAMALAALSPMLAWHPMPSSPPLASPVWKRVASP